MNETTRRQKIEAMLAEEPGDDFLRYCLAMEMDKDGDNDESLTILSELSQQQPPYISAFFMGGQQLARLERYAEARTLLRDGIEAARAQGDDHAAGEMAEFLMGLGGGD